MNNILILLISTSFLMTSCFNIPDDPNPGLIINHAALPDGHKVCVIGDSGKKSSGQALVAKALLEENCDQIRHTGDIIYPDGIKSADDPEFKSRFYDYYKPIMDKGVPFYMSVGNHDYKLEPEAWLEIAKKYETIKMPSMYYMDIYEDICFITFDTNSRYVEQKNWMDRIQKDYTSKCSFTLAFGHHPRYSSGKHGNAFLFVKKFLNAAVKGRVDTYIAGHEHNQEDYGMKDGTQWFVSGGAGEFRYIKGKPPVWAQAKLGYMIFTLHRDEKSPYMKYYFYRVHEETGVKTLEHYGALRGMGFK